MKVLGSISEKLQLLGHDVYTDIPAEITLKSLPTISELDYAGAEDYDTVMLDKILPQAVEEKINFRQLLEIDYQWVLRCLRILNYGPYYTTNRLFCDECHSVSSGEYQVNLNTVECKPLPEKFVNKILIKKDEFIDFSEDIVVSLPTISQILAAMEDKAFKMADGRTNRELARICYMIKTIGMNTFQNPVEVMLYIKNNMSAADYVILKDAVFSRTDYGLRTGGYAQCPKCGSTKAAFIVLANDRFFRPTLRDLRKWKYDRSQGEA